MKTNIKFSLFASCFIFLAFANVFRATHILGGEITWRCNGTGYVFDLILYRDCNGADVNIGNETIQVWGNSAVTSIPATFISRQDISPICTQVGGGPSPFLCGVGASNGNGIGALEKIIYRSATIVLPGIPSTAGWAFTYVNTFRSGSITNLTNPASSGITIVAKMYASPGNPSGCFDNSPQFLQDPYFVSCAGDNYQYNGHAIDTDLDSLAFEWDTPLNNFSSGAFNPPSNPSVLGFEAGFSANSPMPDASFNPLNIPANLNPSTGEITFTCLSLGYYCAKVKVKSFRNGSLVAEVSRETQFIITACTGTNSQPEIVAPFGVNDWETEVFAGDLVNFNLQISDLESLQNGTPQSVIITSTSPQYGTNFTSTSGCAVGPCATLNQTLPYTNPQTANLVFNWQTDCAHVTNPQGNGLPFSNYLFVVKVQDNYCPVPRVTYASIKIKVKNRGIIGAPEINCITGDYTTNFSLNWTPVVDPTGSSFISYLIENQTNNVIQTINTIGSFSASVPIGASTVSPNLSLNVKSGCNIILSQGVIRPILLKLTNPSNGTAVLQWNDPLVPARPSMNAFYYIYREYPAGTWTLYDSVPYGTTNYIDTIRICNPNLNYQIILDNTPCDFTSNIEGGAFQDMLTPSIPLLNFATIDTLSGLVTITWNQNNQSDTYGYVVYSQDASGNIVEIDTVWGIANTNYIYSPNTSLGPLQYSIAAFDSCFTPAVPPTYQTSAKGNLHITSFLTGTSNSCERKITVNWTAYVGFIGSVNYTVYAQKIGMPWVNFGSTSNLTLTFDAELAETYKIAILATSVAGITSFSNPITVFVAAPDAAEFNYLTTATVVGQNIEIRSILDAGPQVSRLTLEKFDETTNSFIEISSINSPNATNSFSDADVDVDNKNYTYKLVSFDVCGDRALESNTSKTNLLSYQKQDVEMNVLLTWSGYSGFNGPLVSYEIFRSINGVFNPTPIATLAGNTRFYVDDLTSLFNSDGEFCYFVEAVEGGTSYGVSERSRSNEVCPIIEPLIYVPNAFTPSNGANPIFIPVISLASPEDYKFTILTRWGQIAFETTNILEGWNGETKTKQDAEEGIYLYIVSVRNGAGIEIQKRGHVTLLRR